MSENNLSVLPIWKKGASLADRLEEMACYARAKPERFEKFVMAFVETLPNGNWKIRTMEHGCDLAQQVGLFELGKAEVYKESER
jgi:hypothetical protein